MVLSMYVSGLLILLFCLSGGAQTIVCLIIVELTACIHVNLQCCVLCTCVHHPPCHSAGRAPFILMRSFLYKGEADAESTSTVNSCC